MRYLIPLFIFVFASMQGISQCYPDRHNTTWHDAWISCQETQSPNPLRGEGHWIQYDLGHLYVLGDLKMWNYNDPDFLNIGAQEIIIDYSVDGENWTEFATVNMPMASGSSIYEGVDLVDLNELEAEHLLLTINSNYGADCSGFAEVYIEVLDVISSIDEFVTENACFEVQVYPNPHRDSFKAKISSECNEPMTTVVYDAVGRTIYTKSLTNSIGEQTVDFEALSISPGIYFLDVTQGEATGRYQIVKMR